MEYIVINEDIGIFNNLTILPIIKEYDNFYKLIDVHNQNKPIMISKMYCNKLELKNEGV